MSLITVIALLLSIFGATVALLNALRSHHAVDIGEILDTSKSESNELRVDLSSTCETSTNVLEYTNSIKYWNCAWKLTLILPVWIFSGIVVILAIWVLQADWVQPLNQIGEIPKVNCSPGEVFITTHPIGFKFTIGFLLVVNIICYFYALVSVNRMKRASVDLHKMWKSMKDRSMTSITPAN